MIILVGASASGKTEVAKLLKKKYNIKKVVTHTTRGKRINEIDGVDYHFIDKQSFIKLKRKGFFVETTFYNDNYYGTSKDEISDEKVLIVDPNGLNAFRNLNDKRIITFLFETSKQTRFNRMLYRGDDIESAEQRIQNDDCDFSTTKIGKIDFVVDSEHYTLDEITDYVYKCYKDALSKLAK